MKKTLLTITMVVLILFDGLLLSAAATGIGQHANPLSILLLTFCAVFPALGVAACQLERQGKRSRTLLIILSIAQLLFAVFFLVIAISSIGKDPGAFVVLLVFVLLLLLGTTLCVRACKRTG